MRRFGIVGAGLLAGCLLVGSPRSAVSGEWFADVAGEWGLGFVQDPGVKGEFFVPESIGAGGAFLDYDGDGDLDVYLVDGPGRPNRLFRLDADGKYHDVTDGSGLGDRGYGMGVAVGDVDGDGDPDVYVTNYGADALYRNEGDGTFTEVTGAAGIDSPGWGCSTVFFDAEGDGDADLYVADYLELQAGVVCTDAAGRPDYCGPAGFRGAPDRMYRNDGGGRFTDVSAAAGVAAAGRRPGKGLGVVAADFDGDGRTDLYVANDGEANFVWINRGDGTFEDRGIALGAALNAMGRAEAGMGVALGDADGDGELDLFVSHLRGETNTLYRGAGDLGWTDSTAAAGLAGPGLALTGFGTAFFDAEGDGDLDLAVVNGRVTRGPLLMARGAGEAPGYWDGYAEPALFLVNDGRGRFRDASAQAGAAFTEPVNGRGLAVGDADGDGDPDLLVTVGGGAVRLLRNDMAPAGHRLAVSVVDAATGGPRLDAVVTATVGGRRQVRPVTPAGSFLSSGDPRADLGLGAATGVDELRVRAPGAEERVYRGLPADREAVIALGPTAPVTAASPVRRR